MSSDWLPRPDPTRGRLALRYDEASAALGISERTLQLLVKDSSGPPTARVGTAVLFPINELQRWLSEQTRQEQEQSQ